MSFCTWCRMSRFQFTHPGRGATAYPRASVSLSRVSIHAPREGCDADLQNESTR